MVDTSVHYCSEVSNLDQLSSKGLSDHDARRALLRSLSGPRSKPAQLKLFRFCPTRLREVRLIFPKIHGPMERTPAPTNALKTHARSRSAVENCSRIRDLGFRASTHITMYGEHFELISDPFEDGECTSVHVVRRGSQTVRTLRLPVAILINSSDRFQNRLG